MSEDHTTVIGQPITQEMQRSYIDYAMSVIVGRALPDARDGLKPVHRRVLYAMNDMNLTNDRPYRKSATVVGETMGKYHPHGDSAIYDTLVRMAQPFSLRYPLVDGQGNFGSVDGDNAAAMRYTECRLSKIASELLEDIDRETVDFADNYDGSRKEPTVLPGKLPNLLVNGSTGIAVGMATNMAPHRLNEIVDGLKAFIDNPDITVQELMEHIPGPDFPTAGIIYGRQGIIDAYTTGRGSVRIRARAEIEETEKYGTRIIVTEIPYTVNKANLIIAMADLVKEKRVEGIRDLRDESDRDGMRVVIELKRDANAEVILNQLYKFTQMETTFGINNLALIKNEPKVLPLTGLLKAYVDHRIEVVERRTAFMLRKAEERAHIVEGLIRAVDNVEEVIQTIRSSRDSAEARERLMEMDFVEIRMPGEFPPIGAGRLTEAQAKAILELRLSKLTGLEIESLKTEWQDLQGQIRRFKEILASRDEILKIIVEELDYLKEKYGDERCSEITDSLGEIDIEDLIPDEHVVIMTTKDGYIKRMPLDTYRAQGRGGKGLVGMQTKDEDFITDLFLTTTHRYVLFFTNKGRVYWLKGYRIPEGSRQSKGKAIVNLLEGLEPDERVQAAIPIREFSEDEFLFFATKRGKVKKTPLMDYSRPRVNGIIACGIEDGDALIGVGVTSGESEIVLAKAYGKSIRFNEANVRSMGRTAYGVRGVTVDSKDEVVSLAIIQDPEGTLFTVTENGYGKRTKIEEYRKQGRGGQGIITIQTTARNGPVVACHEVGDEDEVIISTERGMVIRTPVSSVRVMGRNTQGVRIMSLKDDDRVQVIATLAAEEVEQAALQAEAAELEPTEPGSAAAPAEDAGEGDPDVPDAETADDADADDDVEDVEETDDTAESDDEEESGS